MYCMFLFIGTIKLLNYMWKLLIAEKYYAQLRASQLYMQAQGATCTLFFFEY